MVTGGLSLQKAESKPSVTGGFCSQRPHYVMSMCFNSLAPGKFEWNFRHVIFKQILVIAGWGTSCEIALIWMSLDFTDDQSTLVQVMAWCRQAASHYLSQCWPRSLSPYGVTRPQWVIFLLYRLTFIICKFNAISPLSFQTHVMPWSCWSDFSRGCTTAMTSVTLRTSPTSSTCSTRRFSTNCSTCRYDYQPATCFIILI